MNHRSTFWAVSFVLATLPSVASAALSPPVSLADAPRATPSSKRPLCSNVRLGGLPPRLDFTRAVPPVPEDPEFFRTTSPFINHFIRRARGPQHGLHVEQLQGPDGEPTWWAFGYWGYGETVPLPMALATQYRTELGFSPGESPVLIGNRVYKSYPNGAISVGSLRRVEQLEPTECPPTLSCCGGKPSRGPGFFSTLPGPGVALGDPPKLSGRDALATVHDMNPYVTFIALDETGPNLAARLVVVSTPILTSSLAWEVHYAFSCSDEEEEGKKPAIHREHAYAYVDARSGALLFARDVHRMGGMDERSL